MKKRKCKIIQFNPPYSINVKTNIGKISLRLLKKHFSKKNKFFNKSNVKISYIFTSNILSFILGQKKPLLQPIITKFGCNCREKNTCPLQNQCQTPNLVYQADVENEVSDEKKRYISDLLQQLLKNSLETINKISIKRNKAKIISIK